MTDTLVRPIAINATVEAALDLAEVRALVRSGAAKVVREGADLTLGDVARAIGVTPAAVSSWERGRTRPVGAHALDYLRLLKGLPTFHDVASIATPARSN